mgnify:CR=1 FL=1
MAQSSGQLAPPLVSVRWLSRQYAGRTVLRNIQLELQQGEFVALLGRSGSGKSTLLKALAGLDSRATGSGELQVPENFSVAFQDSRLLPWLRVLDNIVLGDNSKSFRREGLQVLAGVGLAGRERNWPSDLSGGEQQRAALARCLVRKPALLLADEPFGALDALTRLNMQELLRRLCHQYQLTVLLVTHDVDEAIALAQRVIVLDQGGISLELTIGQQSARQPEQHEIYRQQLLKALGVSEPAEL